MNRLLWIGVLCVPLAAAGQSGQQQAPSRPPKPYAIDPTYEKLATESGGRVYQMDPTHPVNVAEVLALQMSAQVLVAAHGTLDAPREFEAPVSDSSRALVISVSGPAGIEIRRPDQARLESDAAGVRYFPFLNGPVYVVEAPQAGTWHVILSGSGNFAIRLSLANLPQRRGGEAATTPAVPAAHAEAVEFSNFDFLEPGGRPGHEGLFKIQGYPLAEQTYPVGAELSGDVSTAQFEFRAPSGKVLQSFRLKRVDEDYAGDVPVPGQPFLIYATGLDMTGHRFQLAEAQLVKPQTFVLTTPHYAEFSEPGPAELEISLRNQGEAATFDIVVTEPQGWLRSDARLPLYVGAGETKRFTISMERPKSGAETSTTVVITATRSGDPEAVNFATIECSYIPPPQL